jgi:drug/metabolite transporter (DMT)-like permease
VDAVVLASISAALFGAMTLAVRLGLRASPDAERGALATVAVGLVVALAVAVADAARHDGLELVGAWPFLIAGALSPGASQILFTLAIREAGAARASVVVGSAPLFAGAAAVALLDEPLELPLVLGAVLIVGGGIALVAERNRPAHLRAIGLAFALACTAFFTSRDVLVRWLAEATEARPAVAAATTFLAATAVLGALVGARARGRAAPVGPRFRAVAFVPAGLLFGLSYVLLFEAFFRGRVTVVSPLVATETLWGVGLSALLLRQTELVGRRLLVGAALVVAGGILIGATR